MAVLIPPLGTCLSRMTAGQRRVAHVLQDCLEDDCLVWFDLLPGRMRRHPDFIVLHPERGLLFLEVRGWTAGSLKRISLATCTLETAEGRREVEHPLAQARQFAGQAAQELLRLDAAGRPVCPVGWGVVFSGIGRAQMEQGMPPEVRERLLPEERVLYRDDLHETEPEAFRQRLWRMAELGLPGRLTRAQIDGIRWQLFPELRIGDDGLTALPGQAAAGAPLPGGVRVMDLRQEVLARSLGGGHRVIHGAAGSGKTLILGYRCLQLAGTLEKPIQVLCFNATLAAELRRFVASRGIGGRVQVQHFHAWCEQQLETWELEVLEGEDEYYWRVADSVIAGLAHGQIPGGQYGALLIDEGHDFEPEWLRLLTRLVDPESGSLLLLYDDAQSIYKKRSALGFSLASVGIQARGRSSVLRRNYRNSRAILEFAARLAGEHLQAGEGDIPLVEPQAAGGSGPLPMLRRFERLAGELAHAAECLQQWHAEGMSWKEMAVLYPAGGAGQAMAETLAGLGIPHLWLDERAVRECYCAETDQVAIMPIQGSKGLEFSAVVLLDASFVAPGEVAESALPERVRLLHVGITRARQRLLIGFHRNNAVARALSGDDLRPYAH